MGVLVFHNKALFFGGWGGKLNTLLIHEVDLLQLLLHKLVILCVLLSGKKHSVIMKHLLCYVRTQYSYKVYGVTTVLYSYVAT